MKAITTHYGVSERLQGMMCTEPVQSGPQTSPVPDKRSSTPDVERSFHHDVDDTENAKYLADPERARESASFKNLTFAQVTDQIWHFSSVDHGPRCEYCPTRRSWKLTGQILVSAIIRYL